MTAKATKRRHERRSLLEDVAAVDDRAEDRGVGGRAADAAVLERLDEARLRVARRRARLVPLRLERASRSSSLADLELRQPALLLLVGAARRGRTRRRARKPREGDHGAGGAELGVLAGRGRRAEPDLDRLARARPSSARRSCASRSARRARARRASARARPASASGTSRRPGGSPRAPPARSSTSRAYVRAARSGTVSAP